MHSAYFNLAEKWLKSNLIYKTKYRYKFYKQTFFMLFGNQKNSSVNSRTLF